MRLPLTRRLMLVALALALIPQGELLTASAAGEPEIVPNRISVLFSEDLNDFDLDDIEREYGIQKVEPIWSPSYITFAAGNTGQAISRLEQDPRVKSASKVYLTREMTNDPLYNDQWYLQNTGQNFLIGIARLIISSQGVNRLITLFPASAGNDVRWEGARSLNACKGLPCEGRGVAVAVIDSGADTTHPDLQGQLHPASRSFVYEPTTNYTDIHGHGTFIAGLIAARADNGVGMTGVAPSAQIMALESSVNNRFSSAVYNNALLYAAANGAQVINMSYGGPRDESTDQTQMIFDTISSAAPWPILIAAAGNDGDADNFVNYPASSAHVISVGSYDPDGHYTRWSQWNNYVDVSAPGGLVTSLRAAQAPVPIKCGGTPYPALDPFKLTYEPSNACTFTDVGTHAADGKYKNGSGTSYAAPIVAGAAALAKERWPRLTSDGFETLVRATADDAGDAGYDPYYGAGKLNIQRLLSFNFPINTAAARAQFTTSPVSNSGTDQTQLTIQFLNAEGASDMSTVEADVSPLGLSAHQPMALQQDDMGVLTYTSSPIVVASSVAAGTYSINVHLADAGGSTATLAAPITVTSATGAPPTVPPSSAPPSTEPPSSTPPTIVPVTNPTAAPLTITITGPKHGEDFTTNKKKVSLRGEVDADVATISVSGQEQTIAPGETVWTAAVALDEGENTITAEAFDVARARQAQASITITRDTEAPDPVEDLEATPEGAQTRLSWSKPDDDIEGYHIYRVTGDDFEEIGVTRSRKYLTSDTGPFAVTAEDVAGNESDPEDSDHVRGGCESGFADVPPSHFASCAAASLRTRGIVQGWNGGFSPDSYVTRAEFAKMLAGVKGVSADGTAASFRDVPSRFPLAGHVTAVVKQGWASGQGAYFYPNRPVTRMEAARMIVRAAGLRASGDAGYSDVAPGEEMGIAAALRAAGIAAGQDGRFRPTDFLTRGEAVKMLALLTQGN